MKKTNFDFGDLVTNEVPYAKKTSSATPLPAPSITSSVASASTVNNPTQAQAAEVDAPNTGESAAPKVETNADMTVTAPPSPASASVFADTEMFAGKPNDFSFLGLKSSELAMVLGVLGVVVLAIILMRK